MGFGTNPPARNTAIPEDNTIGGGGVSGARFPTLYFRKKISIPSISAYNQYQLNVKFDDAIVVWVNGSEAYRNNIISNAVYNTNATAAIANNGADNYTAVLNANLFIEGENTIAVEVHHAAATSSDLFFDMELIAINGTAGTTITRNPYLLVGKQTGVTIRWQTNIATNSRIRIGTALNTPLMNIDSNTITTNHEISINGLLPDTKYFYEAGYFNGASFIKLQGATDNFFTTLPPDSSTRKITIAAFGDCGRNDFNYQTGTLAAFKQYIGSPAKAADAWLLLGDNAYTNGTDAEYNSNFFNVYGTSILKNHFLYPVPGNHDYANTESYRTLRNLPYYNNFKMPSNGECGGLPSGTQAYYSYNIGDIHFISLDSYGKEGANTLYDTTGIQANWVKADLAANTKKWVIAYWHHPPYTFGSHDSDTETDLQGVRDRFIKILERNGVDLILCGHSHAYERSYLLKNFFANSTSFIKAIHAADSSSGRYNGTINSCPYTFASGKINHGTVYVVAGSSGAGTTTTSGNFNNPAGSHPFSENTGGCFIIEIQGNRLDAKFLRFNGIAGDSFTIMKDVNRITELTIPSNHTITLSASWNGGYNWITEGNQTSQTISIHPTIGINSYTVVDSTGNKTCLKDSFSINVIALLPVNLTQYNVQSLNNKVLISWQTAQENNNNYFLVERSADGVNFYPVKKIISKGNNTGMSTYVCEDINPLPGVSYYRLLQKSNDSSFHYFDIKKIVFKTKPMIELLFVADKSPVVIIIRSAVTTNCIFKITDISGRIISVENLSLNKGDSSKQLTVVPGNYIVELTNHLQEKITRNIIIR